MLKRIYRKHEDDKPILNCSDLKEFTDYLNCIVPGSKIKWRNEKRRYTCIARSNNFIIVAKPFNLKKDYDGTPLAQYSIFDLTQMKCNRDNLVFGLFNYLDVDDCNRALAMLERSLIPWEERFDQAEPDEDGRIKLIPKYPEADETLEISQRGWADIKDVVDEIWVDATYVG